MLRRVLALTLVSSVLACEPTDTTERTEPDAAASDAKTAAPEPATKKPIHLPSQNQNPSKGFAMPGIRPDEVCMEKGFTWLYNGYLKPECGTCHYKDNRYGVTQFAQGHDAAASFTVLKTVTDSSKLLEAVLGNVFCTSCVITKDDPLYADLQYFVQHMDRCEKP